jgi:hypothetical protein
VLTDSDIQKRHTAKCRSAGTEFVIIEAEAPSAPPRRACDRCARLKVRCDFVQPCSRCNRQSMDCTYHRLQSNKSNGTSDERRSSYPLENTNGHGAAPSVRRFSQETAPKVAVNGNEKAESFSGSPFGINRDQPLSQPALASSSLGIYSMQQSSPRNRVNQISSPTDVRRDQGTPLTGMSPFNSFSNFATSNSSLMDLSQATATHQPQSVFPQNMGLENSNENSVIFASSNSSDMIWNSQFTAEDTFFAWKPFEYDVNSDASLDFLFGSDLGFFDVGFSPNDPPLSEINLPLSTNVFEEPADKSDKEEVPDEGIVATFDPGTGDHHDDPVHHSHPSRTGGPSVSQEPNDYLNLLQIDPLAARCEGLVISIFGCVENLQHQEHWITEFFTTENIKAMLFLWAKRYAHHVPIIHLPTFSILTTPDALLFILCVIGKAYSKPGIDTERLQWCVDVFNKLSLMARVNGELDMVNLEAVYILVVLCTWHGNKQQREMARRLYREVVEMARKYRYLQILPKKKTDGSDEAEWKAWIERETCIRYADLKSVSL